MPQDLPTFRKGQPPPRKASYFNALRAWIRALRVDVADGGELSVTRTDDGTVIAFDRYLNTKLAIVVNAAIGPATSSTEPTFGEVQLLAFDGVELHGGSIEPAGNWTDATLEIGARVVVTDIDGYLFVTSENCG